MNILVTSTVRKSLVFIKDGLFSTSEQGSKLFCRRSVAIYLCVGLLCCGLKGHAQPVFALKNKEIRDLLESANDLREKDPIRGSHLAQKALEMGVSSGDKTAQIYSQLVLGRVLEKSGNKEKAKEHFKSAIALEQSGDYKTDADVMYYIARGAEFLDKNNDALEYLAVGIALKKLEDDQNYLMLAYDFQSNIYKRLNRFEESKNSALAFLQIAESANNEKFMSKAYRSIAHAAKKLGDNRLAIEYNKKILDEAKKNEAGKLKIAQLHELLSKDQIAVGDYGEALENAKRAISIFEDIEDTKHIPNLLMKISIIYLKLSSYDQSLAYALALLSKQENTKDINAIASASNQVARVYSRLKLYDYASRYLERTLALDSNVLTPKNRASALRSFASIKKNLGDYPAALIYAEEARSEFEKIKDLRGVVSVDRTLSDIYKMQGDIEKALRYRESALALSIEIDDKWSEGSSLIYLGELYAEADLNKARKFLSKGLAIASDLEAKSLQQKAYQGLMRVERLAGKHQKALSYYDFTYELMQEINSEEIENRVAELKIVQETEKNERMIEELKKTKVINELELGRRAAEFEILNKKNTISLLELKQERSSRLFFVGLTIIAGLTLAFVYMRYRYSRHAEQTLNDRNVEIEKKNANLEELNRTKDRFFSIVSHDLRAPIASVVSLAELLQDSLESDDLKTAKKYTVAITEASNQTYDLVEELLSWAVFQLQNADPLPRQHSAREICQSTIQQLDALAKSKKIWIENQVTKEETLFADRNIVSTVIRNLIANAIKFTPHEGSILVFSEVNQNSITIHIKDSGIGVSEKDQENIFRIDKLVSRRGTDGESGTGFGLSFCKDLIEKNNGQLNLISKPGKGSDFFLTLPRFVS